MNMKIGEQYEYSVVEHGIKRILSVSDEPGLFKFYRPNDTPDPVYGTLALVGDRENNDFFVWADAAVNGYLTKV